MEENFEKATVQPTKKKSKFIVAIIIVAIIALALIAGFVYYQYSTRPDKIFAKAIEKIFEMPEKEQARTGRIELEMSLELEANEPEIKAANEILKVLKLKCITELDLDKKILNENISALYDDEEIISASALIQNEKMFFYLEEIYNKYIRVNEEYLEGIDLSQLFDTTTNVIDEETINDIKQILLDSIEDREFSEDKVELDGKSAQKSTLKLTTNEFLEILLSILDKVNEKKPSDELEKLIESLDEGIEKLKGERDIPIYAEISIYTKGLKNEFARAELALINTDVDEAIAIALEQKSENEIAISYLMNEDDAKVSGATELFEITIKENDENSGTMKIKMDIEEEYSVALVVKYSVDYNAKIELRDTSNNIDIDSLTDEDFNEMYENALENEILYEILDSMGVFDIIEEYEDYYYGDYDWDDYDYDDYYYDDYDYYDDELFNNAQEDLEETNQKVQEGQQRVNELLNQLEIM